MKFPDKPRPLAAVCSRDSRSGLLILLMPFILQCQHQANEGLPLLPTNPSTYSFSHPFILHIHSHPSIITLVLPSRGVHLCVKLGGEGGGGGAGLGHRSAWIPLLTCSREMDWLRCPDFPCGYSNCVIMEVGAEWLSAVGTELQSLRPPSSCCHSGPWSTKWDRRGLWVLRAV